MRSPFHRCRRGEQFISRLYVSLAVKPKAFFLRYRFFNEIHRSHNCPKNIIITYQNCGTKNQESNVKKIIAVGEAAIAA